MSTPAVHLSFVGQAVVVTVDGRTFKLEELKAMGLVSAMHTMFVDRMRDQLFSLADKIPKAAKP